MSPFLLFVVYPPLVASVAVTREKHHIAGGIWPPIQTHIIVPDLSYSCNTMICEAMKHVYTPPDLRSASTAGSRLGSCTVYSAGPGQACEPCPSSCPWARWDTAPPPHSAHCPGARASNRGYTKVREDFIITEEVRIRALITNLRATFVWSCTWCTALVGTNCSG